MNKVGGYNIEDLQPGMSASVSKTVTEADIIMFAGVSTDINPAHLNEEYAKDTPVRRPYRPRHAVGELHFGRARQQTARTRTIYMGQTLKFRAPVRISDTVTATVTVREVVAEKKRCVLDAVCTVGGKTVIDGESTMYCTRKRG